MSFSNQKEVLEKAFTEAYNKLNSEQKRAVDTIEGPVMVIAGPGTGKTQILTLRIANILLQTDVTPSSILALTFTESGAKAMRERLLQYVGSVAYQVPIFTFHGFASMLIREYPEAYEHIIGGRPVSDVERVKIIETCLQSGSSLLRPTGNPTYYTGPVGKIISELKKEYVSPDVFRNIIAQQETVLGEVEQFHSKGAHKGKVRGEYTKAQKNIEKNFALLEVYRLYESSLRAAHLFDFEDMVSDTVTALEKNEDMLRDLQERYQYLLADEHQDVNGSQNKIIELLVSYHEHPNVFVVGDEKQAIYRFQGASLDNFLYFKDRFVDTEIISLTENYRSGQTILDAAHSLVAIESGPLSVLRVPLRAASVESSLATKQTFSHQVVEDDWVVDSIADHIKSGINPKEIALIVRSNKEVETFTTLLRKRGIVAEASADGDILAHPIMRTIEALLQAVVNPTDERALAEILHGAYWGISVSDMTRVLAARSYSELLSDILQNPGRLDELGIIDTAALMRIMTVLVGAREQMVNLPPHRVLEFILRESGLLDYVMARDPFESTRVVRRCYDEVESLVIRDEVATLRQVTELFARRRLYGLPMFVPYLKTDASAVQVMTAHKSKGLEFSIVYIPHVHDGGWGGRVARKYFTIPLGNDSTADLAEAFDDERRLLYVAITRAKTGVYISSSDMSIESKVLAPSRLLALITGDLLLNTSTEKYESAYNPLSGLLVAKTLPLYPVERLQELFFARGFSATSLNNYLNNPWDYVYRNLLRLPEPQSLSMQFGTVVHSVLETVAKHFSRCGESLSDTKIKQTLEQTLGKLPLSTAEYTSLHEKGLKVLYPYIDYMMKTLPQQTRIEMSIRVLFETGVPAFPLLPLSGKLDRIDLGEDGYASRVVDYKTGKPKTRAVIEGDTASSDGSYKRQLVFYALLLSLHGDDRYICRDGLLTFVESDAKGVIREELFTVTSEEIEELKETISQAVQAFVAGDFVNDKTIQAKSAYAHLLALIE